jgi:hypothetical protein
MIGNFILFLSLHIDVINHFTLMTLIIVCSDLEIMCDEAMHVVHDMCFGGMNSVLWPKAENYLSSCTVEITSMIISMFLDGLQYFCLFHFQVTFFRERSSTVSYQKYSYLVVADACALFTFIFLCTNTDDDYPCLVAKFRDLILLLYRITSTAIFQFLQISS